jgi:hypothetical protein
MSSDEVLTALRAKAAAYQPDRAAILDLIHQGQATLDSVQAPRVGHRRTAVRAVGMAATMAAVLGSSVAVTWAAMSTGMLGTSSPEPVVTSAPPSRSPAATHGPVATGRPTSPSPSRSSSHASSSPPASPSSNGSQQGFLRSSTAIDAASIDNWTQGNVTVVTSETVTALEVTVRVVATPRVSSTGSWSTIRSENLVTAVEEQAGALVYRFTLKPGVSLGPGSYVFGVQYGHAVGGRDPSRDTYQVVATANGKQAEVNGGF